MEELQYRETDRRESQIELTCFNCSKNFDMLNNTPYKLPCSHTACKSCLRNSHKEKKEFKCTVDGRSISLQELKTLSKNAEIIQKLKEKRIENQSPEGRRSTLNRNQQESTRKEGDEYMHMNSLLSNNFSVYTPIGETKEQLPGLMKFELRKPSDQIEEEEKTPMHEGDSKGEKKWKVTNFAKAVTQEQEESKRRQNNDEPTGRIAEAEEDNFQKTNEMESQVFAAQKSKDQTLHMLDLDPIEHGQQVHQIKNQAYIAHQNQQHQRTPKQNETPEQIDDFLEQHHNPHIASNFLLIKHLDYLEEADQRSLRGKKEKVVINDPHHGRQLSYDSQHYINAQEYVEDLINKSSQAEQSYKQTINQWASPLGQQMTEVQQVEMSTVGKGKKSKKKGKKKKKKSNANASYYVEESYMVDGVNDLSEIRSQKSDISNKSKKSSKSQRRVSQSDVMKSAEGLEEIIHEHQIEEDHQNNDVSYPKQFDCVQKGEIIDGYTSDQLQQFLEHVWFRYDADNDGHLEFEETNGLYEDVRRDRPDLELDLENHRAWFDMIDTNQDGMISREEMHRYCQETGYDGRPIQNENHVLMKQSLEIGDLLNYIDKIWIQYCSNSEGSLKFMESRGLFADLVAHKPELGLSLDEHRQWFDQVDQDQEGSIKKENLLKYFFQFFDVVNPLRHLNSIKILELEAYIDYLFFKYDSERSDTLDPSKLELIYNYFQQNIPEVNFAHDPIDWFSKIDVEGTGLITKQQMIEYFVRLRQSTEEDEGLMHVRAFVEDLVKMYDTDEDGKLNFHETYQIFDDLYQNRVSLGLGNITHPAWFNQLDNEKQGLITSEQLAQYMHQIDYFNKIQSHRTQGQKSMNIQEYVDQLWEMYDADQDGFITIDEAQGFFDEIMRGRPDLGFHDGMLEQWFNSIDVDGDQVITKHEMLHYFISINYNGQNDHQKSIEEFVDELWTKYDEDNDGLLELAETRPFFETLVMSRSDLGLKFNLHESWFNSIDSNGDGRLSKEEILSYFISINYSGYINMDNLKAYVDYLWSQYDADGDGFLVLEECRPFYDLMMLHRPDLQLKPEGIQEWYHKIDIDGDQVITKPEMLQYFISINYSGRQIFNIKDYVDKIWDIYDKEKTGYLNLQQTKPFFNEMVKHRSDLGFDINMHEQWFRSIDVDDDGSLSKNEMLNYFMSINYSGDFNKINLQAYIDFIYEEFDQDKDGQLSKEETKSLFEELIKHRPDLKMSTANHGMWFKRLDQDGDGTISKQEMMEYLTSIRYSGKPVQNILSFVNEIYQEFDEDKDGFLTLEETEKFYMKLVSQRTDLNFTKEGHQAWFLTMDLDGDGTISKHEMLSYLISINYSGVFNKINMQSYVEYLWSLHDTDNDGSLNLGETKQFYLDLIRNRPDLGLSPENHQQWFSSIDVDGDQHISKHEMSDYFASINYSGKPMQIIQNLTEDLWFKYDTDRDGKLTMEETLPFFQDLLKFRTDLDMKPNQHEQWFQAIDFDQDGFIFKNEMLNYLAIINYTGHHDRANSNAYVEYLWAQFDVDRDGALNDQEIKPLFEELINLRPDLKLNPNDLLTWFKSIDQDGDGSISKHEMMNYFDKINFSGRALLHIKNYVEEIWLTYDVDRDGYLALDETLPFYLELISNRQELHLASDRHQEWFDQIDHDKDGRIAKEEMFSYFASIGYSGKAHEISHLTMLRIRMYVDILWANYDNDNDGYLQFEETLPLFEDLVSNRKDLALKKSDHEAWFTQLDNDNDKRISKFEMYDYFIKLDYFGQKQTHSEEAVLPYFDITDIQGYVEAVWKYHHKEPEDQLTHHESKIVFSDLLAHFPIFGFHEHQDKQWFDHVDSNADGLIERHELLAYLRDLTLPQKAVLTQAFSRNEATFGSINASQNQSKHSHTVKKQGVAGDIMPSQRSRKPSLSKSSADIPNYHERKTPPPIPEESKLIDSHSQQSLPSNSVAKSSNSLNQSKNHAQLQKNLKNLKMPSQETITTNYKIQQISPIISSQRVKHPANEHSRSIKLSQGPTGSQEKHKTLKLVAPPLPMVNKSQEQKSVSTTMIPKHIEPISQVPLPKPIDLKHNSSSLPQIKAKHPIVNELPKVNHTFAHKNNEILAQQINYQQDKQIVKNQTKSTKPDQKPISALSKMKDFIPKAPTHLAKLNPSKNESDIQLSSKMHSQNDPDPYSTRMRNNFVMSDKSYHQEEIQQQLLHENSHHHPPHHQEKSRPNTNHSKKVKQHQHLHDATRMSRDQSVKKERLAQTHEYNSLDEIEVPKKMAANILPLSEKCINHPKETIKYFCRDQSCLKGLCPDCIIEHSKHDFIAANELASFELKQLVKLAYGACKDHVKIQKDIKNQTEKKLNMLNKMRNEEFSKIHAYFAELKKSIDEREHQLTVLFNKQIKDTESNLMKDLHVVQQHFADSTKLFKLIKVFGEQQGMSLCNQPLTAISSDAGVVASAEVAYQMSKKANQKEVSSKNMPFYVLSHDSQSEIPMPSIELDHCKIAYNVIQIVDEREKIMQIGQIIPPQTLEERLEKTMIIHYTPGKSKLTSPSKNMRAEEVKGFAENLKMISLEQSVEIHPSRNLRKQYTEASTQTVDMVSRFQKHYSEVYSHMAKSLQVQSSLESKQQIGRENEYLDINDQDAITAASSKNIHWFKWDTNEVFKYDLQSKTWQQKHEIKTQSKFLFFSSIVHLPNEQGCFILGGADNNNNYSKRVQYFCKYNVFIEKPPMINKRAFFPTIFSKLDNSLYCIGGSDSNSTDLSKCEKFSLIENVWRPISPMNLSRNGTAAVIFEQYRLIFVFGGNNHKHGSIHKIEKYEIDFDKWSIIVTSMKTAIHDLTVFPVGRERVLILGGHTNTEPNKEIHLMDLSFECFKSRSGNQMTVREGGKTYFPPTFDADSGKIHLAFGYCDIQPSIEEIDISDFLSGHLPTISTEPVLFALQEEKQDRRTLSLNRHPFQNEF